MLKKRKYYYCRHCGKRFNSFYMADICFQLDMKLLGEDKKVNVFISQQTNNKALYKIYKDGRETGLMMDLQTVKTLLFENDRELNNKFTQGEVIFSLPESRINNLTKTKKRKRNVRDH